MKRITILLKLAKLKEGDDLRIVWQVDTSKGGRLKYHTLISKTEDRLMLYDHRHSTVDVDINDISSIVSRSTLTLIIYMKIGKFSPEVKGTI